MFQMLALHHSLIFVFPTPAILRLWAAMTTISVSEHYRWKIRWKKWGWQYLKGKESFKTNQSKKKKKKTKRKGVSYNKTRINMLHVKKKSTCWPASTTSWGGISSIPISKANNLESSFTCDISQRIIIICTHSSC